MRKLKLTTPGSSSDSDVILFIDLALYRKLKLETFFANDHCLEDESLGVSAINISSIGDGPEMEEFIKKCACATKYQPFNHCEICSEVLVYERCCETCMHVHYQRK